MYTKILFLSLYDIMALKINIVDYKLGKFEENYK